MELGTFVKQYKGKDLGKVPKSKLRGEGWYVGIKFDGNYMQIHKNGTDIRFFTSTGEEMYILNLAKELISIDHDFIIECEFNNNSTGLKLNDRRFSSTGTPRADFKKRLFTVMPFSKLAVFDVLYWDEPVSIYNDFEDRMHLLDMLDTKTIHSVSFSGPYSLDYCKQFAQRLIREGGEGAFAYHKSHMSKDKGRSNFAIKLKADNKKTMLCLDVQESDTVPGEWGALVLSDGKGIKQPFGGLSNKIRRSDKDRLIGNYYEVRYESLTDGKYIQGFINEN